MFSFIDQCEDQLLNKHSVPLLDIVVAFTVGFIVGKVAGHLNDLYLKKKNSQESYRTSNSGAKP